MAYKLDTDAHYQVPPTTHIDAEPFLLQNGKYKASLSQTEKHYGKAGKKNKPFINIKFVVMDSTNETIHFVSDEVFICKSVPAVQDGVHCDKKKKVRFSPVKQKPDGMVDQMSPTQQQVVSDDVVQPLHTVDMDAVMKILADIVQQHMVSRDSAVDTTVVGISEENVTKQEASQPKEQPTTILDDLVEVESSELIELDMEMGNNIVLNLFA